MEANSQILDLNSAYRTAFGRWAEEVKHFRSVSEVSPGSPEIREAEESVNAAESNYRLQRDRLVDVMLSAEHWNTAEQHRRIERLAYEIWEQAGRPRGTAQSDWLRAESLVLAQTQLS